MGGGQEIESAFLDVFYDTKIIVSFRIECSAFQRKKLRALKAIFSRRENCGRGGEENEAAISFP